MKPSGAVSALVICSALLFVALTAALSTNFDFRAFYCAGRVANAGADPYLSEPLHTCERTQTDGTFHVFSERVTLPAPLPGYDIAGLSLLARLPFKAAAALWTALLVLSSLVAMAAVRRLSLAPWPVIAAAFLLSLCVTSIYLGELIPVAIAAIALAAVFAREGRWTFAAIAAAATLVEPHIGVPVCAALALWAPRTRIALAICVAALGCIAAATLGMGQNLEYLLAVLPAHAVSEIGSDAQLSASVLAHAFGASDALAVRVGEGSYAIAFVAGIYAAAALQRRYRDAAFLVLVPAAAAVIGGVFIHVTEVVAALPFALTLLRYEPQNALVRACIVLLAVPWWSLATPMVLGTQTGCILAAFVATFLIWQIYGRPLAALCVGLLVFTMSGLVTHWYSDVNAAFIPPHMPLPAIDGKYPEAGWAWENARYFSTGALPAWLLRLPTWCGLLALGAVAMALTAHTNRRLSEG